MMTSHVTSNDSFAPATGPHSPDDNQSIGRATSVTKQKNKYVRARHRGEAVNEIPVI